MLKLLIIKSPRKIKLFLFQKSEICMKNAVYILYTKFKRYNYGKNFYCNTRQLKKWLIS